MDTPRPRFISGSPAQWPLVPYFGALVFGVVISLFFSAALDGPWANNARAECHAIILLAGSVRFAIARRRNERNRTWIVYVIAFLLVPVMWHFGEAVVYDYSQRPRLVHFGTAP